MIRSRKSAAPKARNLPETGNQAIATSQVGAEASGISPLDPCSNEGVVLIGQGTKIKGEIIDSSVLDIRGEFEGDANANSTIVRKEASFKGRMQSQYVEVQGLLEGFVTAEELLDIRSTGCVNAEVRYGVLAVVTGACLTGSVHVQEKLDLTDVDDQSSGETAALNGINGHHISIN